MDPIEAAARKLFAALDNTLGVGWRKETLVHTPGEGWDEVNEAWVELADALNESHT